MSKHNVSVKKIAKLNRQSLTNNNNFDSILYLDTGNITKNKIDSIQYLEKGRNIFPSRAKRIVKDKTIIYSTVRPNQEHYGFLVNPPQNFIVSTGFTTLDVIDNEFDAKYLYYCLTQKKIIDYLHALGEGSVSAYPSINPDDIGNLVFPFPKEKAEQKKIAAVLSALDAKIEINNRINSELEAMAKTLYDYWFVQFDFPGKNGKPYKSSGGKMVYNPTLKREIPEGWLVLELRNLVEVVKGNISPADIEPTTPYVGLEHIGRKTIVLSDWTSSDIANSDKTLFKKHDILFGKIRPYFHKVAVAIFDGITSTDTIILRPKKKEYFGLALETVFTEKFVNAATRSSTGSKMPRADWSVLQYYKVPVPDSDLLQSYQDLFDKAIDKIEISVLENRKLSQLRDWLLPMLMNGQVRVV